MTVRYCGPGGNNANSGLTYALRKLTLNGLEDTPVEAGDICYIAPGTYRELLTCDVSGSAGSPIEYRGDYTGASTDGVGGVVRITGSDNDQVAVRANCITANGKNYRTFQNLSLGGCSGDAFSLSGNCANWTIDKCFNVAAQNNGFIEATVGDGIVISNCYIVMAGSNGILLTVSPAASVPNTMIQNCIFSGGSDYAIQITGGYDATVKNCTFISYRGPRASGMGGAGAVYCYNNVFNCANVGAAAAVLGELVENYNSFYPPSAARVNVNVGANSNTYLALWDMRWFFEALNSGRMISPFDLASHSQLVNVAGTSPTTTDLRGTAVQGAQREWGALEYDSTLILPAAAEVIEAGGGTYHAPDAGEVTSNAVYGPASTISGTYHRPETAEVIDTATFGIASAQNGTVHLPAAGEVINTAVFGPASGTAGTFAIPVEADVKDGTFYGAAGTEFEGEYVAGGVPVIGGNVVRR